jgi:hypothetical protein
MTTAIGGTSDHKMSKLKGDYGKEDEAHSQGVDKERSAIFKAIFA